MSDTFQELIQAMEFAQSRFEQWGKDRVIGNGLAAITEDYNRQRQAVNVMAREGRPLPSDIPLLPADQCWSCRAAVVAGQAHCADCGRRWASRWCRTSVTGPIPAIRSRRIATPAACRWRRPTPR